MRKEWRLLVLMALMVGLTGCKSKTETALEIDSKTSTEVTEKAIEGTTGEAQEVTSTVEIVATKKDENGTDESTENSGNRQQSTTEGNRTTTGSNSVSNSNSSDTSADSNSISALFPNRNRWLFHIAHRMWWLWLRVSVRLEA